MKEKISVLWFSTLLLVFLSSGVNVQQQSVLQNIQEKIDRCFIASFTQEGVYTEIEKELLLGLESARTENMQYHYRYWLSYLMYYQSMTSFKNGELEDSQKKLEKAMQYLDEIKAKDSEAYSLLSLEQIFNFQNVPRQEMMIYMTQISKNLEMALKLDESNVRSNYVNGYYDFYTPTEYGGGKKAEKYLLKAINGTNASSLYSPAWGKADAYHMLIQLYLKQGKKEQARQYYQTACALFPANTYITNLKKHFE